VSTTDYKIEGMTCDHCRESVRAALVDVNGVDGVSVDLADGRATVSGEGFTDEDVRSAVEGAGYAVEHS
jgi:copper chaperone